MATTSPLDTETLRLQAIAVAAARQTIAHEADSHHPTWGALTDQQRAKAAVEASWWLEALRRAGLTASEVPARQIGLNGPTTPGPQPAVPCPHCGAPVLWLPAVAAGRVIPIDAELSEGGNVLVTGEWFGVLLPKQATAARAQGKRLHTQHGRTCPFAHRWAKGTAR